MEARSFRRKPKAYLSVRTFFLTGILLLAAPAIVLAQQRPARSIKSSDGTQVIIPGRELSAKARFFSFRTKQNVLVRFFAILDRQKKAHVAFDACDVCFQAKKGYRIVNGYAICNNCGQRFPLRALGTDNIHGGCWPSYLPMETVGNSVVVRVRDLEKKSYLFR